MINITSICSGRYDVESAAGVFLNGRPARLTVRETVDQTGHFVQQLSKYQDGLEINL